MNTREIVDSITEHGGIEAATVALTTAIVDALRNSNFVIGPEPVCYINRDARESVLPVPRLQLRWLADGENCVYELVLPLGPIDIRRNYSAPSGFLAIPMGHGIIRGGNTKRIHEDGSIETPYRDRAHIAWDAGVLKLPAFVIAPDGRSKPIEPKEQP